MRPESPRSEKGSTIAELLIAVAIVGLICTFVVTRTEATAGGLKTGTDRVVSTAKLARSTAMATTTPHRVVPGGSTSMKIEYGGPCGDAGATWTPIPDSEVDLDDGTEFANTAWEVCFTTRGFTTGVHEIRILEGDSYQNVQFLLGGSARVEKAYRAP